MRREGRRVAGVRDEENGRDDRKSLVLSPPSRLRLPRPAAHTLGALGSTRLPGSNLFSATTHSVFLHYLLQFYLSLILCISKHIHISFFTSRRHGSGYAFCYILNSLMRPLPACAASHRRLCTVLCERGPGSCAEKPRGIASSSVAR